MAWKICGLLGTLTLGLAAMGCDSSSDGGGDTGSSSATGGGASSTAVTTDGATGTTGASPYTGHLLSPMNGWVARDTNDAGIQGAFYTFNDNEDGGTFAIEPATYENAGAEICASGTAEQVLNMEYAVYWGGAIGFNLNQEEGSDDALAFDATTAGVTGFGFDISALPIGGQLRFNVLVAGEPDNNYCATISAQTGNEFRWEDLKLSCWAAEAATPNPAQIQAVHWQIVTNDSAPYDFDFCVSNITALTN